MLEGDGLVERWEASQKAESTKSKAPEFSSSDRYSDLTDDSSLLVQAMDFPTIGQGSLQYLSQEI